MKLLDTIAGIPIVHTSITVAISHHQVRTIYGPRRSIEAVHQKYKMLLGSVRFVFVLFFCFPLAEIKMGFWLNKWIQWWKWLIILISQPLPLTSQFFSNIKHEEFVEFDPNTIREPNKRLGTNRTEIKIKIKIKTENAKKKSKTEEEKRDQVLQIKCDSWLHYCSQSVCVCVSFFLLSFLGNELIGVT